MKTGLHYKIAAFAGGLAIFLLIAALVPYGDDKDEAENSKQVSVPAATETTKDKPEKASDSAQALDTKEASSEDVVSTPESESAKETETKKKAETEKDTETKVAALTDADSPPAETAPAETPPAEIVVREVVKPRTGHDKEVEAALTKILEPLLKVTISEADKKNTKAALDYIRKDRFKNARVLRAKIKNADCQALVDWYGLRRRWQIQSIKEIEEYRTSHLDWPDAKVLRSYAEAKLYRDRSSSEDVLAFFKEEEPISGPGKTALARAYLASGEKEKAREIISTAWRKNNLTRTTENEIVKNFKELLTTGDHKHRADRFLFKNKKTSVAAALRAAKYLSAGERKKINARIAVIRRAGNAAKLIAGLSEEARKAPGVTLARVRWARRKKKNAQAWELLKTVPSDLEDVMPPDGWWKERRIHVRNALDAGKYQIAYEIAKNHGPVTVNSLNQAETMAGRIAFRHLKKPEIAKQHFAALRKSADGPRTRSTAHYWLGRTSLELKQDEEAKVHFAEGAKYFNTFYGQLSRQALDKDAQSIDIPPPEMPGEEAVRRFTERGSVRALIAAHLIGRKDLENKFLLHLRYHFNEADEMVLLAELAKQMDNAQQSVRIGKRGMFLDLPLAHYAYPTYAMPEFKPLRSLPERSFVFAIARQESEFNSKIVSHAGARGLMQVMPRTARGVSKAHKVKYRLAKLTSDPSYNAAIASAYISDRLDEFSGSYIMTMAGFNAGPGRVRQWVRAYGDPRKASVDPIDWVERIPFHETRNYVMKVLSNIQVYRARLGEPEKALRIVQDLYGTRKSHLSGVTKATN